MTGASAAIPSALGRRSSSGGVLLRAASLALYVLLLLPLAGLTVLAFAQPVEGHVLSALRLASGETLTLLLGVGVLSASVGVGAAWLIAMYRFPLRDILAVLLVAPLALPTYLAAYVAVELTDYFGPLQSALRLIGGYTLRREYWFPDVRTLPGAILVLSLVLYPYAYLAARIMFERQGSTLIQAARLQGCTGLRLFLRIGLPLARPAVIGGGVFALLETLNDIGAVEHLGVQSLSLAIKSVWLNRGNLPGAAQISLLCLVMVVAILMAEHAFRRHAAYAGSSRATAPLTPIRLTGFRAALASLACAAPVIIGFALPAAFLAVEAYRMVLKSGISPAIVHALANSVMLSAGAAAIVAAVGISVALAARLLPDKVTTLAPRIGAIGYAVPGTVLVIALLPVFAVVDNGLEVAGLSLALSGGLAAVLTAYVVRFTGMGIAQAEAGLSRLSRNIDHAARMLGAKANRLAFTVLMPNILPAVGLGALLVFVDAMKELPATLLLRPLNTETLATSLYAHASAGSFEDGAIEGLLLLLIGLIPVSILARARSA
ncbi:MAG TPA: iron ABC transporter permease [Beijerinckiaceae bacterium]|nr:iron ABC transporter permease [Beijerinckiaceae bacterium]